MSQLIDVMVADRVQTIRMNRPEKKNALTSEMYAAMAAALSEAYSDDAIRCVLFLGTPGAFSAGNDIGDFMRVALAGGQEKWPVFDCLEAIISSEKPLVAGVDGLAIGIGTTMLMHCDYVLATPGSSFKTPFTDLGLVPEAGSSLIGPQLMGHHRAFAMLAMGETFSADEARAAGIVNRIHDSAELEKAASEAAARIAAKPAHVLATSRKLIRGDRADILKRMRDEADIWVELISSDEAKAAFASFLSRGK